MAAEEDKKMTDNWKADADGILIFVSSHSTSDLSMHVNPKIKDWFILCCRCYIGSGVCAGPQAKFPDISSFYLANIYQILANTNGSLVLIPSTLPDPSMPFSPPNSVVWVNSHWFLSLAISLTCALIHEDHPDTI